VLISEHLGDFSALVQANGLGHVLRDGSPMPELKQVQRDERERLRSFALQHFTKQAYDTSYHKVVQALS
jgi:hypothetical protein